MKKLILAITMAYTTIAFASPSLDDNGKHIAAFDKRVNTAFSKAISTLTRIDSQLTVARVRSCDKEPACKKYRAQALAQYNIVYRLSQDLNSKMESGYTFSGATLEKWSYTEIFLQTLHEKHPTFYPQFD